MSRGMDWHERLVRWNTQRKRMVGGERCACGREWPCPKGVEWWREALANDPNTYAEP